MDVASSDDAEGASQRAMSARSAVSKARPRSASSAPPAPSRNDRTRASSNPSRSSPLPTAAPKGAVKELLLLKFAELTTRTAASKAWQTLSGLLPLGTLAPIEAVTWRSTIPFH